MTYRYPWDNTTVPGLRTRLVEDGEEFRVEYDGGNNATEERYRHNKRAANADARFMGSKSEFRLVAHLSPSEQLKVFEETGVMPGVSKPAEVIWALNQSNYKFLRTIEGKIGRAVKD